MIYLTIVFFVLMQCVKTDTIDECLHCVGIEYECINGFCYCADGYISDYKHINCIKCPGLGEKCFGPCCGRNISETLHCWHGICQSCYSPLGNWICRETMDNVILVSGSQIVIAVALVLGIIATLILIYKICMVNNLRTLDSSSSDGRLSIGSFQLYVDERLRNAPPRYSRTAPIGSTIYPVAVHMNAGFIHDNSLPPPLYQERKDENVTNTTNTIHI